MGYGYPYGGYADMEPFVEESMDFAGGATLGLGGIVMGLIMFFYLLMFGFAIVAYVLQSIGMHTIAKRRGIKNPWLCWLPIGNAWILGSISDQYQYVAKGKVRNRRKVLLALAIAAGCITAVLVVLAFVGALYMMGYGAVVLGAEVAAGAMLVVVIMVYLLIVALVIVQAVLQYMALYDLFASCNPNNSTLFLVLSIFFSVTLPFFVFFSRKKDLGMPPRKELEQVSVAQTVVETEVE